MQGLLDSRPLARWSWPAWVEKALRKQPINTYCVQNAYGRLKLHDRLQDLRIYWVRPWQRILHALTKQGKNSRITARLETQGPHTGLQKCLLRQDRRWIYAYYWQKDLRLDQDAFWRHPIREDFLKGVTASLHPPQLGLPIWQLYRLEVQHNEALWSRGMRIIRAWT